jgi:hypothetical protein
LGIAQVTCFLAAKNGRARMVSREFHHSPFTIHHSPFTIHMRQLSLSATIGSIRVARRAGT